MAGDGTTSVVVLCGALLKKALELLERGVHPTIISDSFNTAVNKAVEVQLGCSWTAAPSSLGASDEHNLIKPPAAPCQARMRRLGGCSAGLVGVPVCRMY